MNRNTKNRMTKIAAMVGLVASISLVDFTFAGPASAISRHEAELLILDGLSPNCDFLIVGGKTTPTFIVCDTPDGIVTIECPAEGDCFILRVKPVTSVRSGLAATGGNVVTAGASPNPTPGVRPTVSAALSRTVTRKK
jgi:hypothetical protein